MSRKRKSSQPPPRHNLPERKFRTFLTAGREAAAKAKMDNAALREKLRKVTLALERERATKMDDDPMPRKQPEESMAVSQVPEIKWDDMPRLNFDDLTTVYPWLRSFETKTLAKNCSERQKLDFLKSLPGAVDGCLPQVEPFMKLNPTYTELRDLILNSFGYVHPVASMTSALSKKAAAIKNTPDWKAAIRKTEAEMILAFDAGVTSVAAQERQQILAAVAIDVFSGESHTRLAGKMRSNAQSEKLLATMLNALPKWERNILTDDLPHQAAAQTYRPTNRQRAPKRGSNAFASRKPRVAAAFIRDIKRTDGPSPPPSMCRQCGTNHARDQCPARTATCSKCARKGHFSSVCRSGNAVVLDQPHPLNK